MLKSSIEWAWQEEAQRRAAVNKAATPAHAMAQGHLDGLGDGKPWTSGDKPRDLQDDDDRQDVEDSDVDKGAKRQLREIRSRIQRLEDIHSAAMPCDDDPSVLPAGQPEVPGPLEMTGVPAEVDKAAESPSNEKAMDYVSRDHMRVRLGILNNEPASTPASRIRVNEHGEMDVQAHDAQLEAILRPRGTRGARRRDGGPADHMLSNKAQMEARRDPGVDLPPAPGSAPQPSREHASSKPMSYRREPLTDGHASPSPGNADALASPMSRAGVGPRVSKPDFSSASAEMPAGRASRDCP